MATNKTKLTWRELLRSLTSDPQEQQRIIEVLGINAMTLRRWIHNETNPRPQNLRLLLNALPQYRKQLVVLLADEFPVFKKEMVEPEYEDISSITAEFYTRLINLYVNVSPHLRASMISQRILQQIVQQLDPELDGLLIMLVKCTPPTTGEKVRSLQVVESRGTAVWNTVSGNCARLFGAESLIGTAVSSKHLTIFASHLEYKQAFPYDASEGIESVVAAPILLADHTAGGLYIASARANYFSSAHIALLERYVELFCLAFEKDEFFPLSLIELGVMPSPGAQAPTFTSFQARIARYMIQASSQNKAMTRREAEKIVWQQVENELLYLSPQ